MQAANPVVAGTKLSTLHRTRTTSSTGILGVSYHVRMGKYQARIQFQGKQYYLGTFDNLEDAAAARKAAEAKLYGDFLAWYEAEKRKK